MVNNRLTLIKQIDKIYGLYQCSCGNIKQVRLRDVINNKTRSCGCLRNERIKETLGTHNDTNTKLWYVWNDMRYRCEKVRHHAYKHYGR